MKKVLFILLFISVFIIPVYASYNLDIFSTSVLYQDIESSNLTLTQLSFGDTITSKTINNNFILSNDYLIILNSYFSPKKINVLSKKGFVTNLNKTTSDFAILQIVDYDGEPVRDIIINYSIIDRPENSTGETIYTTKTDTSGISYLGFKTGNKPGAYIIRANYSNFPPVYIGFHTDETIVPAKKWRMISVNKNPSNSEIENVFHNNVIPEYIYHWHPADDMHILHKKYREVKNIKNHEGYFIILPNETLLKLDGEYKNDTAVVNLQAGWNQIGSPYYYLTAWNSARIISSDNRKLSLEQAEQENIIQNKIFWYKDNQYLWGPNEAILEPLLYVWSGFWVYALQECKLELSPNFEYKETSRINLAPKKMIPSENDWKVLVSVEGNQSSDLINYFGVSSNSGKTGIVRKAPSLSDLMSVYFEKEGPSASDIRQAPIDKYQIWTYKVNTGDNTIINMNFQGIDRISDNFDVYLMDITSKINYNLRDNPEFVFESNKFDELNYRIIVGQPQYVSKFLSFAFDKSTTFVHPNPGPNSNGIITFEHNAPPEGILTLKIYDLYGASIINRDISGRDNYEWDCKNEHGKTVASGIYIYILEYRNSFEHFRFADKLAIVR